MKEKNLRLTFLQGRFETILEEKCSNLRPFLFITFPQGLRIFKNFGHPTLGSGGKKVFKRYLKSEQTHTRTFRLIESIGRPEGQCFERADDSSTVLLFSPLFSSRLDRKILGPLS